jgi:starch-binding outer membrane protein, SusD/RagB family
MKRYNLMNMKISKWLIVPFLSVVLIVSSCQDIIELEPYNQVSETAAFTTPALIELSVMGMYQAAQRGDACRQPQGLSIWCCICSARR